MKYIYLAAPYSHPNPEIRQQRFEEINKCAATLMQSGLVVYSPISHNHPIALAHDLPKGWEFWGMMDEVFIHHCSAVYVLQVHGWKESHGVKAEISLARNFKKPIIYIMRIEGD